MIGFDDAQEIAARYVVGRRSDTGLKLVLLRERTLEREFGWVFHYGPDDASAAIAGNAPFIVDRNDGSIHVTGTALSTETYVDNYARTRAAFPPGLPERTVVLEGWRSGKTPFPKISLTKAIRIATGKGLAESKRCTDAVVDGDDVVLMFPTAGEAEQFFAAVQKLGVSSRREIR